MLKFAVVHAPTGPQKGPGLYEPDHLSGIEESHLFYGDETYSRSYGKEPVKDIRRDPKKKEKKKDGKVTVEKKPERRARVGVDFDGTITVDPRGFKRAIDRAIKSGLECHLVTGRPEADRKKVEDFCDLYGLSFSSMNFFPVHYEHNGQGWDALMDSYIGSWKAQRVADMGVGIFIDDNPIHIKQIVKMHPDIVVLKAIGG